MLGQVLNMLAQPDQIIHFNTNASVQPYLGRKVSEKRYRLSRAYSKYQYQTAQLLKLEFIFHFIRTRVYAYTNRMLQTLRLSRVFLADRKV